MEVTFKNMSNKTTTFNVDPNDALDTIIPKLMEQNSIDPTKNNIRFIFKGKVLDNKSNLSEFKDEPKLVIIYMATKIKSVESTAQPSNTQTPSQTAPVTQSAPVTTNQTQASTQATNQVADPEYYPLEDNWHEDHVSGENADEVNRLRASVIATLFFIRQSPQFTEMFNNDFQTFLGVLSSPQLRPLFEKIYSESDSNDSEYMDQLTDHVADVQQNSGAQQQTMTVELDDQDKNNIEILVSLGFPRNASIQAYILCNKNVDLAASMLMDS